MLNDFISFHFISFHFILFDNWIHSRSHVYRKKSADIPDVHLKQELKSAVKSAIFRLILNFCFNAFKGNLSLFSHNGGPQFFTIILYSLCSKEMQGSILWRITPRLRIFFFFSRILLFFIENLFNFYMLIREFIYTNQLKFIHSDNYWWLVCHETICFVKFLND